MNVSVCVCVCVCVLTTHYLGMLTRGVVYDTDIYGCLLHTYSFSDHPQKVKELYGKMVDMGIRPNENISNQIQTHTHTHTHIHTHTHTHWYTHTDTHTHTHWYTHTLTHTHIHTHPHTYTHTYTCIHAHTHAHAHTHILKKGDCIHHKYMLRFCGHSWRKTCNRWWVWWVTWKNMDFQSPKKFGVPFYGEVYVFPARVDAQQIFWARLLKLAITTNSN
jgi:pentatricopeptide repeat protein